MIDLKFDSERLLTSSQVGDLLQVNPSSVNKWVEEGRIRAFRTPGGHRRIRIADLLVFLEAHEMPIPRKLAPAVRRRLLVVDDDLRQLKAFERVISDYSEQIEVSLATNGIDALVLVGAFKPHLVVLDVYMPQIDGVEVCRRLKTNPDTCDIEVIVASGRLTEELEQKAMASGALRCLPKPLDPLEVMHSAGITLESSR